MTNIKKLIKKQYIIYLNWKNNRLYNKKYEVKSILDKKYTITKGCIPEGSDYDDAWLLFLSSKSEIVFDVGCNIGQSSLLITHSNSLKKLILIEPNPLSLSMAAENLIMNNKSENVIFIPKAAYNKSGVNIKLWSMQGAYAGASTDINFSETGKISKNYFDVETITLDEIVETYNYFPDLVKIDVQGAENDLIHGGEETLASCKHLIVEMQKVNYNDGAPLVGETMPYIESLGFTCVAPLFCDNGPDGDYGFVRIVTEKATEGDKYVLLGK